MRSRINALGTFVMYVAMPALIFLSTSSRRISEVAHPTYLLGFAVTSLVALLAGYVWSRKVGRTPRAAAAFDAMGSGGANSGFVGFPVLLMVLPSVAGGVFGMNVLVETLVTVPLCFFLAERGNARTGLWASIRPALIAMVRVPVLLAVVAGLAVSASGLVLPGVLRESLDLLGRVSTGLTLFSVGGMLVGLSLRGRVGRVVAVSTAKLLVMPGLAVGVAFGLRALGAAAGGRVVRRPGVERRHADVDVAPGLRCQVRRDGRPAGRPAGDHRAVVPDPVGPLGGPHLRPARGVHPVLVWGSSGVQIHEVVHRPFHRCG